MTQIKHIVSFLTWPMIFTACVAIMTYGFAIKQEVIFFNLSYLFLIFSLLILERVMPHEKQWLHADGQNFANIAHTLMSKGAVQMLVVFSTVIGLAHFITPMDQPTDYGIWPREWPLWAQVILGLITAEFMLYWAHRIAHEWPLIWRFHAVHHSVTRLWIVNTGRFHFVDSLFSIMLGMSIPLALGAPMEVFVWISAITAYIGMLTHCNVEMRFGPISWIFNTPELHRWHHSRDLAEGNRNYGENLVIWDQVFGTYINPKDRHPPANIGIAEIMPPQFLQQLAWPFKKG